MATPTLSMQAANQSQDEISPPANPELAKHDRLCKGLRLLALALVIGSIVFAARATGLDEQLSLEFIRTTMVEAGALGLLFFLIVFIVGILVQLPGFLFHAAAVLAYGPWLGTGVSFAGALIATSVTFFLVRGIGGKPLDGLQRPLFKKIFGQLDDHPLRTVVILRLIFWMAPPLNYALALSSLRYKHYLVGSALGLLAPLSIATLLLDQIIERLI